VFDCSFSEDGSKIVSCSFDRTIKMWECDPAWTAKRKPSAGGGPPPPVTNIQGHSARILGTAYSPNGQLVATASRDKSLKVWYQATPPPPPRLLRSICDS